MAFEDLERRLLDAMCSVPATAAAGTTTERQPTQREMFAKWSNAAKTHPGAAPPELSTLIVPDMYLAQALHAGLVGTVLAPFANVLGIDIFVNEHLPKHTRPVRRHKLRHGHTAYHNRIQKKWVKRFGVEEVDCWYAIAPGAFGGVLR